MRNTIIVVAICLFTLFNTSAQILTALPCYTVNDNNGNGPSNLFVYDPDNFSWSKLGEIDPIGDGVEAIAIDPVSEIIYMYDAGSRQFGTVDPNSMNPTLFVPNDGCNGSGVGKASGDIGEIDLDDVDGLTYDTNNNILYGTHHINSGELCNPTPSTNDLLFQIDPSTGCYIPGAMQDVNGDPADYAIIEETFYDQTIQTMCDVGGGGLYDVDDIAYNHYNDELFAIQSQAGGPCVISILDPISGTIEAHMYDLDEDNVEGLAFTMFGELYATSGDGGLTGSQNAFIHIDLLNITTSILAYPDPTGMSVDFEAIDCLQLSNDLALNIVLDPSIVSPVQPGDNVTFNITVHNQGNINNSDITIVDYIPDGLILNDPNWSPIPGTNIVQTIISSPVDPNDFSQVSITFTIDPTFTGETIDNYAEISASFNQNIVDFNGDLIPLPDNDSTHDQENNDNEDEDDHDVATITISNGAGDCPILVITEDTPLQNLYQSNGKIITNGNVLISAGQQVEYQASKIELNSGFEAFTGSEFDVSTIMSVNCDN